jgi:ATP-dependent Lhr-like helicase
MGGPVGAGRWSILKSAAVDEETRTEELARQYIKRYGVVFRDLLARETHAPPWRDLLRVYRRLEMRGELRGGRFCGGFIGEQFAAPEAVEALRAVRKEPKRGEVVRLSACDPLNLVGILTPGPRVPAMLANSVVFVDGVPQSEPSFVESRRAGGAAVRSWSAASALEDRMSKTG